METLLTSQARNCLVSPGSPSAVGGDWGEQGRDQHRDGVGDEAVVVEQHRLAAVEATSSVRQDRGEHADHHRQAELDGAKLTDWDILGFCFVLVAGGNDTTGNLVSHGVMLLDGDHAQRDRLVDEPELIPNALLEFLRLEGSVQGLARTTLKSVTIRGVAIPEGEKVMMLYASGNRDEREFGPTAGELDSTRKIPRHLAFSSGVHFCIGSHLARLQGRIALEELLARHPHVGVDLDNAVRLKSAFTRGWTMLPATGLTAR